VSTNPGPDELRVRQLLIKNGVGPDAGPAPVPPKPAARPRDWLDDILDETDAPPAPPGKPELEADAAPEPRAWWAHKRPRANTSKDQKPNPPDTADAPEGSEQQEEPQNRPRAFEPQPDYWPHPHMPAVITRVPERAEAAISPGTRRLLYNASAAGAGWVLGLYGKFARALNDCGHQEGTGAALVLGIAGTALIAHVWDRRTRHWWPGIAWVARIPLAAALLALALYAPAAT
jgi:hypothetical protein